MTDLQTRLWLALMGSDEHHLYQAIEAGADVNERIEGGGTPLHRASTPGIVRALVAAGADLDARDMYGDTPLHAALNEHTTKALIELGAKVNARNADDEIPLHRATGAQTVVLLNAGGDIDAVNDRGLTPIETAIQGLQVAEVRAMLAAGAHLNHQDGRGNSVLHRLATLDTSFSLLNRRERSAVNELVELALSHRADTDMKNAAGDTPLHICCGSGAVQMALALLAAGANVNERCCAGSTPLHVLANCTHGFIYDLNANDLDRPRLDLLEAFRTAGADCRAIDCRGWTPADYAQMHKDERPEFAAVMGRWLEDEQAEASALANKAIEAAFGSASYPMSARRAKGSGTI